MPTQRKTILKPKIEHIPDQEWDMREVKISENAWEIRQQTSPTHIIQEEPETETWLIQEYTEKDIERPLRNVDNKRHMEMMESQEKPTKKHDDGQQNQ